MTTAQAAGSEIAASGSAREIIGAGVVGGVIGGMLIRFAAT